MQPQSLAEISFPATVNRRAVGFESYLRSHSKVYPALAFAQLLYRQNFRPARSHHSSLILLGVPVQTALLGLIAHELLLHLVAIMSLAEVLLLHAGLPLP